MKVKITKVLIANRGEIAIRILTTAKSMGIKVVTIYTEAEKDLPHRLYGDESYSLGSGTEPLKETYLCQQKILDIARLAQVDAIHPGYGLLSENAEFAKSVEEAGFIFIGPTSDVISMMGDKITSKKMMEKAGIPLIPGYHGDHQDLAFLLQKAQKIGFPVLIKASAGGGGKGMRIVESVDAFQRALEGAQREALNAFGNSQVFLEKYLVSPRHIEVQVFSDTKGNHLHLFERECSIQRRHQKIIEETPSPAFLPFTDDALRENICQTAVKIAQTIHYRGAGTVEFMLDHDQKFYFLEMNTRLQVEHPITEAVTGLDLVRLQFLVAQGEALPVKQTEIEQRGHAIEVRLCAEDPDNEFLPSVGKIVRLSGTLPRGIRLDCGYLDGNEVTINFDPMLAKVISYAETRERAIAQLLGGLDQIPFLGVKTNREYLKRILSHEAFVRGETTTHFIEDHQDSLRKKKLESDHDHDHHQLLAHALALWNESSNDGHHGEAKKTAWDHVKGWKP